ncbi:response regulator [Sphingomonas koreensis]|nr:response regulator [Sphingomonas koreensis]
MADSSEIAARPIVVIVDDDEAIRAALGRLIRTIGYEPRVFASGEDLLIEIDNFRPACVLTDIQMPGMNGLELAGELHRCRRDLPVAVMTAYPSLANRDLTLAGRTVEHMTKPLDDRRLEAWLSQAIGAPPQI